MSQPAFAAAEHFAVHILAFDQQELSNRFAQRGEDKFSGLEPERGPGAVPLLKGCAARFKCRTAYRYEGGDHDIIVGEVIEFDHFDKRPLLFHRGQYSALVTATSGSDADLAGSFLGFLLSRAQHALLAAVKEELRRLDIGVDQYFALCALGKKRMTIAQISEVGQFYDMPFDRSRALALKARDLLDFDTASAEESELTLTDAGRQLMWQLLAVGKAAEETLLEQFEPSEGQWLKSILRRLGSDTPTVTSALAIDP